MHGVFSGMFSTKMLFSDFTSQVTTDGPEKATFFGVIGYFARIGIEVQLFSLATQHQAAISEIREDSFVVVLLLHCLQTSICVGIWSGTTLRANASYDQIIRLP